MFVYIVSSKERGVISVHETLDCAKENAERDVCYRIREGTIVDLPEDSDIAYTDIRIDISIDRFELES